MKNRTPVSIDDVTSAILCIRSLRVILDEDLAALYGVSTGQFNRAVRRNLGRFPPDFMFQLTEGEALALKSADTGRGGRRYAPLAFTEHGAIMAATVLNSPKATDVSVYVVRAFVRFREMLSTHEELSARLAQLEKRLERRLGAHDLAIREILHAIRTLTNAPPPRSRPIGFIRPDED